MALKMLQRGVGSYQYGRGGGADDRSGWGIIFQLGLYICYMVAQMGYWKLIINLRISIYFLSYTFDFFSHSFVFFLRTSTLHIEISTFNLKISSKLLLSYIKIWNCYTVDIIISTFLYFGGIWGTFRPFVITYQYTLLHLCIVYFRNFSI